MDDVEDTQMIDVENRQLSDDGFAETFGDIAREKEYDTDSGEEMSDEDNIPLPLSSDDEEDEEKEEEDVLNDSCERASPNEILALGQTFGDAYAFKQSLLRYSLQTGYDIKLYLSTGKKLGAICSAKEEYECPWRVYCSYEKSKHKLQVKAYVGEHICIRSGYSKMVKVGTIAQLFEERLRVNQKFTAKEMVEEIKRDYNLNVSIEQCKKARSKITKERRAIHASHFARVWDYQAEILSSNPGTTMEIETIPGPHPGSKQRFDRLYICFAAQRKSWMSSCRPIIGLDGAFLKWDIKGQLIAAIGRDGDNKIVPIAWAVVEIENDSNWDWFINHLRNDLRLEDGKNISIISDKQKGLVKAVHNVLPQAEHRMCARHILANWKRDRHDINLERLFWKIARSYTNGDYVDNLEELKKYNGGAFDSLMKTNPSAWSRAFFKVGSFCDDILNNLSESFNRTIREARRKPLLDLLEEIRRQCMVRTAKRNLIASRLKTRFTRKAMTEIETALAKSKDCIRYPANGDLHEVDWHGSVYRVDMNLRTCGCKKWQLTGIPCKHAACVITGKKLRVDNYVSEYYTAIKWQQTYEHGIEPVQSMNLWPRLNRLPVLPPPMRLRKRGRPKNHDRTKSCDESTPCTKKTKSSREKRTMTCSNCREEGHNKLTCSNESVAPEAKKARGRPKKDDATLAN